jgi:hypothetical protein
MNSAGIVQYQRICTHTRLVLESDHNLVLNQVFSTRDAFFQVLVQNKETLTCEPLTMPLLVEIEPLRGN